MILEIHPACMMRYSDIIELVNHVTFWMPELVPSVAMNFDKLFEDSRAATHAELGNFSIVIVTENFAVMFIIAVLSSEDDVTLLALKMLNMILSVKGGDI